MGAVRKANAKQLADESAYMGVTQSARGFRWQERLATPADHALATARSASTTDCRI